MSDVIEIPTETKIVNCRDCGQPLFVVPGQNLIHHQTCGEVTLIRWDAQGNPHPILLEKDRQH